MTVGTTPRNIRYPDPSGVPKRAAFQELAEDVDAAIGAGLSNLLRSGRTDVTVSAGVATLNHPLGRIPDFNLAALATTSYRAAVTSRTATQLTLSVVNATTGTAYDGPITVMWLVA